MSAFHKDGNVYSKDEANICLACTAPVCRGSCDKLKAEKRKLKQSDETTKKESHNVQSQ